jgi:hypothetical protein
MPWVFDPFERKYLMKARLYIVRPNEVAELTPEQVEAAREKLAEKPEWTSKPAKRYQRDELDGLKPQIEAAENHMWTAIKANGWKDGGTCTIGEGVGIYYLPSRRHRVAREMRVIQAPFQGNNYQALQVAIKALRELGVDCFYMPGRID